MCLARQRGHRASGMASRQPAAWSSLGACAVGHLKPSQCPELVAWSGFVPSRSSRENLRLQRWHELLQPEPCLLCHVSINGDSADQLSCSGCTGCTPCAERQTWARHASTITLLVRADYPTLLSAALDLLCDHAAAIFGSNPTMSYMHDSAVLRLEHVFQGSPT